MATNGHARMAETPLSLDTIHGLLAAQRRRYTLYCLYLYANPMQLSDVAEQVTAWEHGVPAGDRLDERSRTYNDLYHSHVPKLADADVVAYSQEEDLLELAANAAQVRPYLERAADRDLDAADVSTERYKRASDD